MATQLAATPVVTGKQAAEIYKKAQQKPSEKSKQGAKKLIKMFAGK